MLLCLLRLRKGGWRGSCECWWIGGDASEYENAYEHEGASGYEDSKVLEDAKEYVDAKECGNACKRRV